MFDIPPLCLSSVKGEDILVGGPIWQGKQEFPPLRGEAETGKGPVDLFPAERAHMLLVCPGREQGKGEGENGVRQLCPRRLLTYRTPIPTVPPQGGKENK